MFRLNCLLSTVLCLTLFIHATEVCAQDIPDTPPAEQGRIVEGRPPLYSFKRGIHPLTWVEAGIRPIVRSSQSGWIHRLTSRPPNPYYRVGFNGMGAGSGFGPEVTVTPKGLLGRGIEVEFPLLYTYRDYQRYGVNVKVPVASQTYVDRLTFDVGAAYRSRASDNFFGIGNDSLQNRADVRTVTREASVGFSVKLNDEWKSGLHLAFRNTGVTQPSGVTSAQDMFRDAGIPGLFTGGVLRSTELSLGHDTRDRERVATSGGLEQFEVSLNEGIGKGDFAYWKYRFEFQRFFPLTRDHRKVIALRGMAETNQEKGGSRIPFFDMPVIGNFDTVRGLANYRYYDKSAMSVGIEYRYRIWRPMDWGLFVDAGQVAPEPGDFGLRRFHPGYGIRMIAMPKPETPITVDLGRSRESWRWYVSFNPKF